MAHRPVCRSPGSGSKEPVFAGEINSEGEFKALGRKDVLYFRAEGRGEKGFMPKWVFFCLPRGVQGALRPPTEKKSKGKGGGGEVLAWS